MFLMYLYIYIYMCDLLEAVIPLEFIYLLVVVVCTIALLSVACVWRHRDTLCHRKVGLYKTLVS